RVRQTVAGQSRDLGLLRSQLAAGLDGALTGGLAGGEQLAAGPLGERPDAHRAQLLVGGAELRARLAAAALAAQPLPVEQVRAGELCADPGPAEPCDGLAVERLGVLAVAEQS